MGVYQEQHVVKQPIIIDSNLSDVDSTTATEVSSIAEGPMSRAEMRRMKLQRRKERREEELKFNSHIGKMARQRQSNFEYLTSLANTLGITEDPDKQFLPTHPQSKSIFYRIMTNEKLYDYWNRLIQLSEKEQQSILTSTNNSLSPKKKKSKKMKNQKPLEIMTEIKEDDGNDVEDDGFLII
ncbi:hypothetical protein SNEBB_006999 [Seison nebaliae]|nr:hypothetical protein SNEBB_006999 [Seison nebaliae]